MNREKLEYCPKCHEQRQWVYDFQRCQVCGYDRMQPLKKTQRSPEEADRVQKMLKERIALKGGDDVGK